MSLATAGQDPAEGGLIMLAGERKDNNRKELQKEVKDLDKQTKAGDKSDDPTTQSRHHEQEQTTKLRRYKI